MADQNININIKVRQDGALQVKRDIENVGKSAKTAEPQIRLLQRALQGFTGAVILNSLKNTADRFNSINNLLRITSNSQAEVNAKYNELVSIANRTRVPLDALVGLYQKASIASGELGASQEKLFEFVKNVGLGLAQQGGSAASAQGALIQLSQSLGSGIVRAEEFNSILEGAFPIALAAAKGLEAAGGSVSRLRSLVVEGKVTSKEFFDAILKQSEDLEAAFAKTNPTISQSITVLNNNWTSFIGKLDQTLGISKAVSLSIIFLGENLENIASLAVITGAALTAAFIVSTVVPTIKQLIALEIALGATSTRAAIAGISMKAFQGSLLASANSMIRLNLAMLANPVGVVLAGIAALVTAFAIFKDSVSVTSDGLVTLGDVFGAVMSFIPPIVAPVVNFFSSAWSKSVSEVEGLFGKLFSFLFLAFRTFLQGAKGAINTLIGVWVFAYNAIKTIWSNFPEALKTIGASAINGLVDIISTGVGFIVGKIGDMLEFIGSAATLVGLDNPFANLFEASKVSDSLKAFKIEISKEGQELGSTFSSQFENAFGRDFLGEGFDKVLGRAREISSERRSVSAVETPEQVFSTPAQISSLAAQEKQTEKLAKSKTKAAATIEDLITSLDRETQALGLNSNQLELQNVLNKAQDKLKRSLTQSEIDLLTQKVSLNSALKSEKKLQEEILPGLDEQIKLLSLSSREQEIYNALKRASDDISRDLTDSESQAIKSKTAQLQLLRDEKIFREDILGSLEKEISSVGVSNRQKQLTNALLSAEDKLKRNLTNTEKESIKAKVSELQLVRDRDVFYNQILPKLQKEADLIGLNNQQKTVYNALQKAETDLGRQLTDVESQSILNKLEEVRILKERQSFYGEFLPSIQKEIDLVGLSSRELAINNSLKQAAAAVGRELTVSEAEAVISKTNYLENLKQEQVILNEIQAPLQTYSESQDVLNRLFEKGAISLEEYTNRLAQSRDEYLKTQDTFSAGVERGINGVGNTIGSFSKDIENTIGSAFGKAGDALQNFVKTGKFDFKDLASSIINDLIRITVQQGIVKSISESLGGLFGGGGGGGGGGFGSLLGSLFGGGGGGGGFGSLLGGLVGGGLGFSTGGSFTVGGGGGVDSQMVAFRASPGERVKISRPGEDEANGSMGGGNITVNIQAKDIDSFKSSEIQIASQLSKAVNRAKRVN